MAKVLLINIDDKKGIRIKNICRKLYFGYDDIEKADFGHTLGYLLGESDDDSVTAGEDFDDEMLYLVDIDGGMLNIFLAQLRKEKATVPLKAVRTDTNTGFSVYALHRELSAERDAIARGTQAH